MGRILLIRHAEAEEKGNEIMLTKKGVSQAKALAEFLSKLTFLKAFVSNSKRTLQTYEEYRKLKPKVPAEISPLFQEIYRVVVGGAEKPGTPQDKEQQDKERAEQAFSMLAKEAKEKGSIALFAHANLIRFFISKTLNMENKNLWDTMFIDNASVSLIEISKGKQVLRLLSSISHLGDEETRRFFAKDALEMHYFS
jgi:broad specificity phosphatase PhoE